MKWSRIVVTENHTLFRIENRQSSYLNLCVSTAPLATLRAVFCINTCNLFYQKQSLIIDPTIL